MFASTDRDDADSDETRKRGRFGEFENRSQLPLRALISLRIARLVGAKRPPCCAVGATIITV